MPSHSLRLRRSAACPRLLPDLNPPKLAKTMIIAKIDIPIALLHLQFSTLKPHPIPAPSLSLPSSTIDIPLKAQAFNNGPKTRGGSTFTSSTHSLLSLSKAQKPQPTIACSSLVCLSAQF